MPGCGGRLRNTRERALPARSRTALRRAQRGFTFIEIVVVLLILAILVVLGLTAYHAVRQRPHRADAGDILPGVRVPLESSASRLSVLAARGLGQAGLGGPRLRHSRPLGE